MLSLLKQRKKRTLFQRVNSENNRLRATALGGAASMLGLVGSGLHGASRVISRFGPRPTDLTARYKTRLKERLAQRQADRKSVARIRGNPIEIGSFRNSQDSRNTSQKMVRRITRKRSRSRKNRRYTSGRKASVYKKRSRGAVKHQLNRLMNEMNPLQEETMLVSYLYDTVTTGRQCLFAAGSMRSPWDFDQAAGLTGQNGTAFIANLVNAPGNRCVYSKMASTCINQSSFDTWVRPVEIKAKRAIKDGLLTVDTIHTAADCFVRQLDLNLKSVYDATDDALVIETYGDQTNGRFSAWLCYMVGMPAFSGPELRGALDIKFGKWRKLSPNDTARHTISNQRGHTINMHHETETGIAMVQNVFRGTTTLFWECKGQIVGTNEVEGGTDADDKINSSTFQVATQTEIVHGYRRNHTLSTVQKNYTDHRPTIDVAAQEHMDVDPADIVTANLVV